MTEWKLRIYSLEKKQQNGVVHDVKRRNEVAQGKSDNMTLVYRRDDAIVNRQDG